MRAITTNDVFVFLGVLKKMNIDFGEFEATDARKYGIDLITKVIYGLADAKDDVLGFFAGIFEVSVEDFKAQPPVKTLAQFEEFLADKDTKDFFSSVGRMLRTKF